MKKIGQLYKESISLLKNDKKISTPNLDLSIILSHLLKINSNELFLYFEKNVDENFIKKFELMVTRRINREPIANILNKKSFWEYDFFVNQDVLTPRNDSETLIKAVLESFTDKNHNLNILDLGTGSGCLILTLLKIYKNSNGFAIDISDKALDIAKKNANLLKVNSITFIKNNWNDGISEKFDIIISNPPYISKNDIKVLEPEVNKFNPMLALDGGDDGLDCYKYLAENLSKNMKKNSILFFEIGQNQENDIINIFTNKNFKFNKYYKDLSGTIRVLSFSLKD